MCMRYVSIQQTIWYSMCKISDFACGAPFWTVMVRWYPQDVIYQFQPVWWFYWCKWKHVHYKTTQNYYKGWAIATIPAVLRYSSTVWEVCCCLIWLVWIVFCCYVQQWAYFIMWAAYASSCLCWWEITLAIKRSRSLVHHYEPLFNLLHSSSDDDPNSFSILAWLDCLCAHSAHLAAFWLLHKSMGKGFQMNWATLVKVLSP